MPSIAISSRHLKGPANRHGRISAEFGFIVNYLNTGRLPDGRGHHGLLVDFFGEKSKARLAEVLAETDFLAARKKLSDLLGLDPCGEVENGRFDILVKSIARMRANEMEDAANGLNKEAKRLRDFVA